MTTLGKSLLALIIAIIAAIVVFYFYHTSNSAHAPSNDQPGFTATPETHQNATTTIELVASTTLQ